MPIDPSVETVVSLTDATSLLPRRRRGKKPHVSCLYRWTTTGCKGTILESIQVGGTRCTSVEALSRFFEALTYGPAESQPVRSFARRQRAAQAAERELHLQGA